VVVCVYIYSPDVLRFVPAGSQSTGTACTPPIARIAEPEFVLLDGQHEYRGPRFAIVTNGSPQRSHGHLVHSDA